MASYRELNDQCVLVTGGANGIGAATGRAFVAQGARVFFSDIVSKAGEVLAMQAGPESVYEKVDLRQERQVGRWIKRVAKRCGAVQVLVNNAARDPRMALE